VTTIKVSYAPAHEVYQRQVTADTAVPQHLHDPLHGWGWTLFFLEPGGHRVGAYFIPATRPTWTTPWRRPSADSTRSTPSTEHRSPQRSHADHRRHTIRHPDGGLSVTRRRRIDR
jgi:hypothetical protein